MESKITKQKNKHRYREQIGDCQRQGLGVGKMGKCAQKVQASSYKIHKSWECTSCIA